MTLEALYAVADLLREKIKNAESDIEKVERARGYHTGYKEGLEKVLEIVEDALVDTPCFELRKKIMNAEPEGLEYISAPFQEGRAQGWEEAKKFGSDHVWLEDTKAEVKG